LKNVERKLTHVGVKGMSSFKWRRAISLF